ncbi:MAG: type II toxin-antitoxin system VapB family antitoxin [Rubrobacteraceae bacterium]
MVCMRTTLDINDKLLEDAVELSGEKTKTAAVEAALKEYVRLRRKEMLLSLPGTIQIEDNWRELRQMEIDELSGLD